MVVLTCPYCGQRLKERDKYCEKCGNKIDRSITDQMELAWKGLIEMEFVFLKLIVLFSLILFSLAFIGNMSNIPFEYSFWLSFPLTILVYILLK